eukprot:TRINITY_DN13629_c0_g1_i19.p1 TRINITY_DN13629_c0_g1~~TRINITY_DN13629_c0_g1_i19.p1  ORF type:complete len:206 (-),score=38.27 TRINITY_DN13629_c0_g1_i19:162-779(-)
MRLTPLLTLLSLLCLCRGGKSNRRRESDEFGAYLNSRSDTTYTTFDDSEFLFIDENTATITTRSDRHNHAPRKEINEFVVVGDDFVFDWEEDDSHILYNIVDASPKKTPKSRSKPAPRSNSRTRPKPSSVTVREEEFRTIDDFIEFDDLEVEIDRREVRDVTVREEVEPEPAGDYWTSYDQEDNTYDVPSRFVLSTMPSKTRRRR